MRDLIKKTTTFASEEEINKIIKFNIGLLKKAYAQLKTSNFNIDDEINYSLEYKENVVSATKIELIFNTQEIIVLINVMRVEKDKNDTPCFDFEGDNEYIDPNGNYLFMNEIYQVDGDNIMQFEADFLFDSRRTKMPTI